MQFHDAPRSPRILSPAQLSELIGLSLVTIWRLRRRGELPAPLRISAGRVGWPEAVIQQWLDSRDHAA